MLEILKKLFGLSSAPDVDFKALVAQGAILVDVRSQAEFASGHIKGAINIPLDSLEANLHKLKDKQKPIITHCASGRRSGIAKGILISKGYVQVYNGGGWQSLKAKLS
jgi:rhodanese-related sulfurtransferase